MITIRIRIQKLRATLENSKVPMLQLPWGRLYRKKKLSNIRRSQQGLEEVQQQIERKQRRCVKENKSLEETNLCCTS